MDEPVIHPFTQWGLNYLREFPLVGTLLLLMGIDVITGCLAALLQKRLNSTVSFRGMVRKTCMLILIGVGAILEHPSFGHGMPLARMIALTFIITESFSILENVAVCGVPVPKFLVDALEKVKEPLQVRPHVTIKSEGPIKMEAQNVHVEDSGIHKRVNNLESNESGMGVRVDSLEEKDTSMGHRVNSLEQKESKRSGDSSIH